MGVGKGAICLKCHSENENQKGYFIAKEMKKLTDSLIVSDSVANSMVFQAEQRGMDVEELKFKLREIRQARLEGRTIVHSFDESKFKEVTAKGFKSSDTIITEAKAAVEEFYFRRYGLGVAVAVITFLIVMLFLYIKKIEKTK